MSKNIYFLERKHCRKHSVVTNKELRGFYIDQEIPSELLDDAADEERYKDYDTCKNCYLIINCNDKGKLDIKPKRGFKDKEVKPPQVNIKFPIKKKEEAEKKLEKLNNLKAFL